MTTTTEVAKIADRWLSAKRAEKDANDKRLEIEKEIVELLGCPKEGTEKTIAENFCVRVKGVMNPTLDEEALAEVLPLLPDDQTAVYVKHKTSTPGLKKLEAEQPEAYKILCRAMTLKPGKPSINVELKGENK